VYQPQADTKVSGVFELNHAQLEKDSRLTGIAAQLGALSPIDSDETFNRYCREACRLWREHFRNPVGETSARFPQLLEEIQRRSSKVMETSWGGVVITEHQHPRVEKWLVIRAGGYLALEMHEQKHEHLEVTEGAGLILWRRLAHQALAVQILAPGAQFDLAPGQEHCLIGTENLLVFERSVDPKGMDQDLIFIYEPESAS
jgi:mannose-6-phosphate isomerase-like protein (cupin superfamily)